MDPHTQSCEECAAFVDVQRALISGFDALADDARAPVELEARLLAEFDGVSRGSKSRLRFWVPAGALVASGIVIAGIAIHRPARPRVRKAEFIEIPYTAPLAPYERTQIVRMEVPVAALIAAGFDVDAPDTGAAVKADVLFGQDGRAHAFRLLPGNVLDSN